MEHRNNHVRLQRLRRVDGIDDRVSVDFVEIRSVVGVKNVHRVLLALGKRQIVEPLRVGNKRDFYAVDVLEQHAPEARLIVLRRIRSHMRKPCRVQIPDGTLKPGKTVLNRVRVCRLQNIEANRAERLCQRLRRAEIWLSGVWLAAEIQLQIADREVRRHGAARNGSKARGEIIGPVVLPRRVELLVIHHDIADGSNGHGGVRLRRHDRFRRILLRIRRLAGLLLLRAAALAAADNQNHRQNQNHQQHAENNALLHLAPAALFEPLEPPCFQQLLVALKFLFVHKNSFPGTNQKAFAGFREIFSHYTISRNFAQRGISPAEKVKPWRIASNVLQWLQSFPKECSMKNHRSHVGRTRLILILLCIVLAAAMLWCALSLVLKIGTYSSRTVGDDKPAEEVPVAPADLEPTVAENSYDPAGFYEEGGFKRYKSADTIASVGVDVSSHQQDIDWELVAANGVEFAMIRVGYRGYTEGEIQPDDYFTQNIEGALAAGLDVGVYFFSQALDEKEAIDEANFVLESIKDYPLSYPVIFDWEDIQADARTDGMDSIQLTKNALAFCGVIEKAGYRAGVYFNQRFGYEEFDLESLQDYVFWLAEYNETPSFSYHFQLWQYCNDGRVDGIQTDVDLNLAFLRAKH